MQVSAIGLKSTNFKGYDDEVIDVPYQETYPVSKKRDALDSVDFQKVATTLESAGANKVTSPCKFFIASAAVALAAFVAARAACGGALNRLDNKFGMFEGMGKRAGEALTQYVEKHPHKEGKGFGIYCSNKMRDLAQGIIEYGRKGLTPDAIKGLDEVQTTAAAAGQAIKKGASTALGIGVAGATIESRYKDTDKNGVPDKAEGAMSAIKEVAQLVPALVDAAGI
ncbi:MAG: hypothetical protein K6A44_06900 [bacterium]|nr:hypothetical protein [bacterium]